ncbi:MAG: PhoH family protein [Flavobacteriales bacterium]|nr:PhoH family protein [Flavobacteriales bacterium]MCB9447955.1 PhoH family protein [Flavobacteriales bacterium]
MSARKKNKKIYILDTSVILHDHDAIFHFEENDIAIPITVLEELDNFKKGNSPKNYEAREFIRIIDRISVNYSLQEWIPIDGKNKGKVKIIMNESGPGIDANMVFDQKKPDHKILNAALQTAAENKNTPVILVTKDINLRLKAKALNLTAEDYETGKIKDIKNLYSGRAVIEDIETDVIMKLYKDGELQDTDILGDKKVNNHFFILKNGKASSLAFYSAYDNTIKKVEKQYTYGIKPRNAEQTFAMHAIMNPEIKLVTIQGVAGTGKTLLALAGCLEQKSRYNQIILARPIVPLSNKDIGYLPGDVHDKINPYMEPLWDNLKFIKNQFGENEKRSKMIDQMQKEEKIVIAPLAYIRGRSLSDSIFIVDESQNLTPHEVKTIITRAGDNTKIIFTGDVFQIDTPYLDEQSNGLSYLIDRLKGNKLFAHITLEKGERSELANLANELL